MRQKQFLLAFLAMLLCFASPSFAQNVAKIGNAEPTTLAEAIKNASAGQTITLLGDVTENVTISKSLTIDGAGNTYTGKMTGGDNLTITVKNVNFVNAGFAKTTKSSKGNYTFIKCNFDGKSTYAYPISLKGCKEVVVKDCNVKDYLYSFLYVSSSCSDVTVKNTVVDKCPNYGVYFASGVTNSNFENVTIKNSNNGFIIGNSAARKLNLKNCSMEKVETAISANGGSSTITCNLSGANNFGTAAISEYASVVLNEGATLTAPEYANANVTTNVEGYNVVYADGKYYLYDGSAVAKIGDEYYGSLAKAIAAATDGQTITLLSDRTENVTINKSLTIDGAGKTFTGNIQATNKKDVVIKNVNFDGKGYNGYAVEAKGAYNITIEDCTVKNYGYGFLQNANGTVSTTVKNVTIEGVNYGVKVDYANEVLLENVKMTNVKNGILNSNYGVKTITIKNSELTSLNIWERNQTTYTTFKFEGVNTIAAFPTSSLVKYEGVVLGNKAYGELTVALAAVKADDVLNIYSDYTIENSINVASNLTINGNGKTLTYTGSGTNARAITVESTANGTNLTLKNLTVDCTSSYCQRGINYNTNGSLVLDGVTVKGKNVTYALNLPGSSDGANVTINNSSLTGNIALNVWGENSVINATNTVFTAVDNNTVEGYAAVKLNNDGTTSAEGTVINIEGGKIDVTGTACTDTEAVSNGTSSGVINISNTTEVSGEVVEMVAVIRYADGNSYSFTNLTDAIAKANDGETVTLLRDITASEIVTINKAITLDGNGKKLTSTAGRAINVDGVNGVIIKNLTINASGERAINVINNATNVTVEGVTATAANYTVNLAASAANAVVAIKASNLTGLNVVNVAAENAQVTINGGTITCNDQNANENYAALALNKAAVNAKIVATGVTFDIKGDSVKASNGAEGGSIKIDDEEAGNKIVAVIEYEGTDNYYSFYTLADAVAAAQVGETVKLIANATGAGVVIDKSITIDFDGKTYTFNEGVGSTGTKTNGFQILKGNDVVLMNGTLNVAESAKENFYILVQNYANLTVNGMNLDGTNLDKWSTSDGDSYVLSNNCGTVNVIGSTITANNDGALAYALDACLKAPYEAPVVTVAEGSTINGNVEVSATLNMNGTLNGNIVINGAEGVVKGAEGLNVSTNVAGRNVVYANGAYTTAEFEPVAKVNGKMYASLREAVDAAPAGATVYLLKDVTLEGGYADDPDAGLRIEKAIKINGQFKYTIDCGKFQKGIRVYNADNDTKGSNEFYGVTIVNNNVNGRCIDTRDGNINLIITESHLKAQNGNSQPLTLGGSEPLRAVTIRTHSTIDAGKSGYAVINFVTPGRFINVAGDCKISGYAAFYVKADNTKLQLANVVVTGENVHNGDTNGFGAIVVESSNNTITLGARAKVKAVANSDQFQSAFLIMSGSNNNIVINDDAKVPAEVVLEGENAYWAMVEKNSAASTSIVKYGAEMPLAAECDNYQYLTFDEAFRAANDGSTVKLLANVALDTQKLVAQNDGYATLINVKDKAITLDLNGKTINVAAAASDLENAEAKGGMLLSVFHADTNGQLTLVDSSEAQTGAVNVLANDAKIYCLAASESIYEDKSESGKIIVNGGTYTLDRAADSMFFSDANEVITINGGNFTLGNVGTGSNGMPWIFNTYERNERHVNVNGGTFNADINHQYWAFEVNVPKELALRNNGNGTWTVVDAEAWVLEKYNANYNREVGYATLEEALAVSNNVNNTVTLVKDVEVVDMITVANGKTLVLNLNGKTLSAIDNTSKNYSLIDNRGDLTITGEGVMTVKATVNSGWNRYSAVIANNPGGKLTVNGGTIEHLGGTDMAYGIDNLTNGKGTYAETIINGGTIKSTYRAVRQFLNGVEAQNILTVNGGTIEGTNKSIFFHDPSAKANNGTLTVGEEATLKGDVYLFVTAGSTEWPVEVMIAKDALEGESTVVPANVPEGYAVTAYSDKWVVEQTKLATLTISDDCDSYENIVKKTVGELTYVRNFENEQWQTIYLPFAMLYADVKDEFEVAYIYNAKYLDNEATIDYVVITDDNYELEANRPYLIRAKEEGVKSIVVKNATLMPTAVKSIDCSSVYETFTFTGNYSIMDSNSVDIKSNKGYFTLNEEGEWGLFDGLNPFRAYMTIELRNGKPFTSGNIIMRKVDKNGNVDTSVEKIGVDADILGIYDLQGRRVLEPQKGEIYIINGKKVVF